MNSNTNSRTGNWGAFGSSGRTASGFGRQATSDVQTSTAAGGAGWSAFSRPAGGRDEGAWSAFGGPRDERADQRRQEREAEAAREAAAARAKKNAEEAAAEKLADATNFASDKSYPSLGGGRATAAAAPALSWKAAAQAGAAAAAAREVEERALRRPVAAAAPSHAGPMPPRITRVSTLTYDYEDDEELEEDDYAPREPDRQRMAYAGDSEDEEDGEFNADIMSGRRRGDKGIW